jgi:hypothetical protein
MYRWYIKLTQMKTIIDYRLNDKSFGLEIGGFLEKNAKTRAILVKSGTEGTIVDSWTTASWITKTGQVTYHQVKLDTGECYWFDEMFLFQQ